MHPHQLRPIARPAVDEEVVEGIEGAAIVRMVEVPCLLAAVEHLADVVRESRAQAPRLGGPFVRTLARVELSTRLTRPP